MKLHAPGAALLLALTAPALAQQTLPRPFQRLADSGPFGVVTLGFDGASYARFAELSARGHAFTLQGLPLPGGREEELLLWPTSALEPGARAEVVAADGSVHELAPRVRCFAGSVSGGGEAFFGLTPEALEGYVRVGAELYFLSSAGNQPGRATLAHCTQIGGTPASFCATPGAAPTASGAAAPGAGVQRSLASPGVKLADLFVEADDRYRALFASDQAAIDYATLLISAASEVYRRDLGAKLRIPDNYLRLWNTTPPWGVITTFSDINAVQAWWAGAANPGRNLPRSAVLVLTNPVFGGVAYAIGGICTHTQGYEISSVTGHFPYPIRHTDPDNWDLFVVTHELGHSFGCIHSFDFTPPIDCQDGSGPDQGTIMSYCHLSFGTGGVGMRFHVREQQRIRNYMPSASCLVTQTIQPGDYDLDGVRGIDDLLIANALLNQGFRSLGAEETFDMDADGDFDLHDRDLLAAIVGGVPARAVERNGSGVNPVCLFTNTNPLLGRTWSTSVLAFGVGRPTFLLVHDLPHAGLPTPYGELLVRPASQGGVRLLVHAAPSDGLMATHDIALPLDLALSGFTASSQGLVLGGPGGTHFCNALDLVLSPFE